MQYDQLIPRVHRYENQSHVRRWAVAGTEVDFVNRYWLRQPVRLATPGQPFVVVPVETRQLLDDGRRLRADFAGEAVRVGLVDQLAGLRPDGIFVGSPAVDARDEPAPDAVAG